MMLIPGSQYMPMMTGKDLQYQLSVTVATVPLIGGDSRYYVRPGSGMSLINFFGGSYGSASGYLLPGIIVDGVVFSFYPSTVRSELYVFLNGHHASKIPSEIIFVNGFPYEISNAGEHNTLGYEYTQIVVDNIVWLPTDPPNHIIRF